MPIFPSCCASPSGLRTLVAATLGCALVAGPAFAQATAKPGVGPARADPADPLAQVPPAVYRSPFAGYRRHAPAEVGSWREANETVNRIGGWRTYAREAQAAGTTVPGAGAAAAGTAAPAASGGPAPATATVPQAPPGSHGPHGAPPALPAPSTSAPPGPRPSR